MNKRNLILLCTAVMILALVGCSKKEETTTETPTETPATPAATPIDQSTVGSVTGKISFEGAKPKQRENYDGPGPGLRAEAWRQTRVRRGRRGE